MKRHACARVLSTAVIAAALTVAIAGPAAAQAWLGIVVGEMAAGQAAAAREEACRAGAPADPDDVASANRRVERAMVDYFNLTSHSTPREIRQVFYDKDDVSWRDASGTVPITDLGARLDEPVPQRTLIAIVVGGDAKTARAIWSAAAPDGSAPVFYAGDFVNEGWLGGWKIWHLEVVAAQPDVPPAYCHFDPTQGF